MKKALLYFFTLVLSTQMSAQCSELFISEYIEGNQYNKALEIYNPTDATIDLSNYRVVRWRNGGPTFNSREEAVLNGMIAPYSTYVAVKEPGTTQSGDPEIVDSVLMAKADGFYSKVYNNSSAFYFNGDDAISLEKNVDGTWTVVDLFATAVGDPGEGWTDIAPPYTTDTFYQAWTKDHTLIRKRSVTQGVVATHDNDYGILLNVPAEFNPSVEWDSVQINFFGNLGCHDCDCNQTPVTCELPPPPPSSVKDYTDNISLIVSPNPTTRGNLLMIEAGEAIQDLELYNLLGQMEHQTTLVTANKLVNYSLPQQLSSGVYFLKVKFRNGQFSTRKLILN